MAVAATQYTLVPVEVTPNKSEKKRKSDEVEHAPKNVSAYNMYVKEQRADVTKKLTELHMSKPSNEQVMQAIALRWSRPVTSSEWRGRCQWYGRTLVHAHSRAPTIVLMTCQPTNVGVCA